MERGEVLRRNRRTRKEDELRIIILSGAAGMHKYLNARLPLDFAR